MRKYSWFAKFTKYLQDADENTRKRWLAGFGVGSAILVILIWGFYFKSSLVDLGAEVESDKAENSSFLGDFFTGLKTIAEQTKLWWQMGNEMMVQGVKFNFVMENMEKIPPVELP